MVGCRRHGTSSARSSPAPRAVGPLAGTPVRLFLTSATLLFVELLLIRWIPANVKYVGFFSNFLLMASFLGIGLGHPARAARPRLDPVAVRAAPARDRLPRLRRPAQHPGPRRRRDLLRARRLEQRATSTSSSCRCVIVLVTALMASLAMPLGPLLRSMPPLRAYAIDIGGSMLGIAGLHAAVVPRHRPDRLVRASSACSLLLLALGAGPTPWSDRSAAWRWSLVIVRERSRSATASERRLVAVLPDLHLPDRPQPASTDPADGRPPYFISSTASRTRQICDSVDGRQEPAPRPAYDWFPDRMYDRVLIIGAGSGTDTALALAKGAKHVDAVEIDPELAADRASTSTRTSVVPRSARHRPRQRRPGVPQRHGQEVRPGRLRADRLADARQLDGQRPARVVPVHRGVVREPPATTWPPDGVFVMYNLYREPWLVAKLDGMLGDVVRRPRRSCGSSTRQGDPRGRAGASTRCTAARRRATGSTRSPTSASRPRSPPPTTGRSCTCGRPSIAPYYLAGLGVHPDLRAARPCSAPRASTGTPLRRFSPHFFVLGIAFLLLETKSLVSFSLLFGTTWVVNALAFFAILASVLLAIFVNVRLRTAEPGALLRRVCSWPSRSPISSRRTPC